MSAARVAEAPASSTQAKPASPLARRIGERSGHVLAGRALAIVSSSILIIEVPFSMVRGHTKPATPAKRPRSMQSPRLNFEKRPRSAISTR
jgi:hypothetical protein